MSSIRTGVFWFDACLRMFLKALYTVNRFLAPVNNSLGQQIDGDSQGDCSHNPHCQLSGVAVITAKAPNFEVEFSEKLLRFKSHKKL